MTGPSGSSAPSGPGTGLAAAYYARVVAPLLERHHPGLPHAAARLGSGSDVLGLDDATSRDHDWGLRLTLLVEADLVERLGRELELELPEAFAGLPTRFATTWDPAVRQRVDVTTAEAFTRSRLGVDATRDLTVDDWLALTGQGVLEVTAGPVFADTDGRLAAVRERLAWYPDDVWLYVVAVAWARLGEELPFVGRAGERGDDLGSRIIAARLAGVLVHLGFLLERRWPPYAKWRGTAFATLPAAGRAAGPLAAALTAQSWQAREAAVCAAAELLFAVQRAAGLPADEPGPIEPFFDRPLRGLRAGVEQRLLDAVRDPTVRALQRGVGSAEQRSDNVAVLTSAARLRR